MHNKLSVPLRSRKPDFTNTFELSIKELSVERMRANRKRILEAEAKLELKRVQELAAAALEPKMKDKDKRKNNPPLPEIHTLSKHSARKERKRIRNAEIEEDQIRALCGLEPIHHPKEFGIRFNVKYVSYINSTEWRLKREEALEIHGRKCNRCNRTRNLQCHHKTYRRLGRENARTDLEILCLDCHECEHGREFGQFGKREISESDLEFRNMFKGN